MVGLVKVACKVEDGLIPSERVVRLESADGNIEEVSVSRRNIEGDRLLASAVAEGEGKILVELPRESASGRWRIWMKSAAVAVG
jgi:hypothetical protein